MISSDIRLTPPVYRILKNFQDVPMLPPPISDQHLMTYIFMNPLKTLCASILYQTSYHQHLLKKIFL